jgi:hypothetical protein
MPRFSKPSRKGLFSIHILEYLWHLTLVPFGGTLTTTHSPSFNQPAAEMMDDFNSETDSDYTSYWRDWVRVSPQRASFLQICASPCHWCPASDTESSRLALSTRTRNAFLRQKYLLVQLNFFSQSPLRCHKRSNPVPIFSVRSIKHRFPWQICRLSC